MATSPATKPIQSVETPKHIRIIGVPLDLGQSRRGVDMGPSAVRVAGLESKLEALGYDVKDVGNVSVAMLETRPEGDPRAKYLTEITETCTKEAELVVKTRNTTGGNTRRSDSSGSTRIAISIRRKVLRAATCMACRWARSWVCGILR